MTAIAHIAHLARLLDGRFWHDYLVTMRPYLLFVSGITGLAGLSLAPAVPLAPLVLLGVVFFLAYGFGQALTDCFQTDTDRLSAPYRPLVRGTILPQDVMAVSVSGLVASAVVVMAFNAAAAIPAGLTVAGIVSYTWFKRRWWGGPWYNAWIVSLVVLIGYQTGVGAAGEGATVSPRLIATMVVALAAYANFVLAGYFKDIEADRATGYRTMPVVFGRRCSSIASDGLALTALAAAAVAMVMDGWGWGVVVASPFVISAALASVVAQVRLHRVRADLDAHRAIEPVVHGYILLLAGLSATFQPTWAPALLAFYLAFVWAIRHRPMAAQV